MNTQPPSPPLPLSARIRPGVEAAPWVIEEIRKLEAQLAPGQQQLTVIDAAQWEPCTPDYLARGGSCNAPRVWHAESGNHWHPRLPASAGEGVS